MLILKVGINTNMIKVLSINLKICAKHILRKGNLVNIIKDHTKTLGSCWCISYADNKPLMNKLKIIALRLFSHRMTPNKY